MTKARQIKVVRGLCISPSNFSGNPFFFKRKHACLKRYLLEILLIEIKFEISWFHISAPNPRNLPMHTEMYMPQIIHVVGLEDDVDVPWDLLFSSADIQVHVRMPGPHRVENLSKLMVYGGLPFNSIRTTAFEEAAPTTYPTIPAPSIQTSYYNVHYTVFW